MNAWRRLVVLLVLAVLFVAACGGGGSGVSSSAGKLLNARVDAIRVAAGRADRSATAWQLTQLLGNVDELRAKGELSEAAAARIGRAAAAVEAQLSLLPEPTTTTTTTTVPARRSHKRKGNGRGKGDAAVRRDPAKTLGSGRGAYVQVQT